MKKMLGVVATAVILLWAAAFFVLKSVHDSETAHMVAVADQLTVPPAWTLESETIEGEKLICLDGNPCPSLSRTWQTDAELRADDLRSLGNSAGWNVEVEGDCARPAGAIGMRSVCSATSTENGYEVQLRIDSAEAGSPSVLWLHLESSGG